MLCTARLGNIVDKEMCQRHILRKLNEPIINYAIYSKSVGVLHPVYQVINSTSAIQLSDILWNCDSN